MRLPALWIALAFAAGILVSDAHPMPPMILIAASVAELALAGIATYRRRLVMDRPRSG
jgi:hypothetical protein